MVEQVEIVVAEVADQELVDATARLLPQLATNPEPRDIPFLHSLISADCTTQLLARDLIQGGRIVGLLTLVMFKIPTGLRAWIEDVVVDESVRGRGIGEALNREAIRIALSSGAVTIDLTSRPSREAANRLYRRIGFEARATNVYRYAITENVPE
jgi:ribosomal protein S18 acetylase RimI-like enzyme